MTTKGPNLHYAYEHRRYDGAGTTAHKLTTRTEVSWTPTGWLVVKSLLLCRLGELSCAISQCFVSDEEHRLEPVHLASSDEENVSFGDGEGT